MSPSRISYGLTSDKGERRTNADAALALVVNLGAAGDFGLFLVADGMGGTRVGEFASALAVQTIFEVVVEKLLLPLLAAPVEPDGNTIFDVLTAAFRQANQAVIRQAAPGGSTLTGVVIIGDTAYIAHVGDTRAYYLYQASIEQLTHDHTMLYKLVELGHVTWEDIYNGAVRCGRTIYRALGQQDDLEVDTAVQLLHEGSRLLLCSDGLWWNWDEEQILTLIYSNFPQRACELLIHGVYNQNMAFDNMTALVVQVGG